MQVTTRKKLPLPVITDTSSTVTPTGRGTSTSGVVRDSTNTISTIADYATDYDADETITGKWRYNQLITVDNGIGQLFTNRTGAARAIGDVAMVDGSNDQSIILPDIVGTTQAQRICVVAEAIASGAVGRVAFTGFIRIKVAAGTTRGMYLQAQSGSAIATGTTYVLPGSFAIAVTNQDVSNTVLAMLRPGGAGGGGAAQNYFINGGFETWTGASPVNGNAAGTAIGADQWLLQATGSNALVATRETTNVDTGSAQAMSLQNTISGGNSSMFQVIGMFAQMRGRQLTCQMRLRAGGAGVTVRLFWNDGVTGSGANQTSPTSIALTAGAYTSQTLTFTPATTATRLNVGVLLETNGNVTVDNCTLSLGASGVDYAPQSTSFDSITVLGVGYFASGSAPAPSIAFINDMDTGIYNPGDGQLAITTNGAQRLLVDNAGLVGLNGTPRTRLDVAGMIRVGGNSPTPNVGAGMELHWDGTNSIVHSYDRSAAQYRSLQLIGSVITAGTPGTNVTIGTGSNSLGAHIMTPSALGNKFLAYDNGNGTGYGMGVNNGELALFGVNTIGFRAGHYNATRGVYIDASAGHLYANGNLNAAGVYAATHQGNLTGSSTASDGFQVNGWVRMAGGGLGVLNVSYGMGLYWDGSAAPRIYGGGQHTELVQSHSRHDMQWRIGTGGNVTMDANSVDCYAFNTGSYVYLPDLNTCYGRVFFVKNMTGAAANVYVSNGAGIYSTGWVNPFTLQHGESITLYASPQYGGWLIV